MREKELRTRDIFGAEKTRRRLVALFESLPAGPERRQNFLREAVTQFSHSVLGERAAGLQEVLRKFSVEPFEDDRDFLEDVLETLLDFIDKNFDPFELEKAQRERFITKENFIPLSEILSFGHDGTVAHIHLAPARTMGKKEMVVSVLTGLRELARRLNEDPVLKDIKEITATSVLVAEHSSLLEKLGFPYQGLVDEETRQKYFPKETQPVGRCRVSREDFLKRYLAE